MAFDPRWSWKVYKNEIGIAHHGDFRWGHNRATVRQNGVCLQGDIVVQLFVKGTGFIRWGNQQLLDIGTLLRHYFVLRGFGVQTVRAGQDDKLKN